jgi:RNA polymerase sigma factor for flagellar operon FliA
VDTPEVLARFHAELPLVEVVARQVRAQIGHILNHDELMSFGREGLLEACRRFDPERGVSLRRFAGFRIRGAMLDGVRSTATSRRTWEKIRALQSALQLSEGMYEDSAAAVAAGLNGAQADERLAQYMASVATAMAMGLCASDTAWEEGEAVPVDPGHGPEEASETSELMKLVHQQLQKMPEQEATLIRKHYLGGQDIDEVARELGLSKSWGSRLLARGMSTLTKRMQAAAH